MSLADIFNSIGLFFAELNKDISNFFNNIWTTNLYNETFLKIVIFIIVYISTWWLYYWVLENQKKIEDGDIKLSPLSQKVIFVGIIIFSYAVTGLIVMFFGIDGIDN